MTVRCLHYPGRSSPSLNPSATDEQVPPWMLGRGPAPGSRVEPTATRALYDPRRDLPRPEPPPKVDPDALLIGFPTNKWEATSEQRHELIAIMQARHPDKSAPELLAMLREQDPTNIYELLLGHGREGEWGPPDRFHTGGYERRPRRSRHPKTWIILAGSIRPSSSLPSQPSWPRIRL